MRLFNLESPFMQALNKVADLMLLNLLTLLCCIPIITIGPSLAGMHYVALKMARDEECYIARDFFKSFKLNFRQGTIIWLMMLFLIFVLACDFIIIQNSALEYGRVIQIVLTGIVIILLFTSMFVFPVLARFENTVLHTIKNAFLISALQFPKTILMMVLTVLPTALFIFYPQIMPLILLFGMSAPAFVSAKLYSRFFRKLEDQINAGKPAQEPEGEDERIFRDELDESLAEEPH